MSEDQLVTFLHLLMLSELPVGKVQRLVETVEQYTVSHADLSSENGGLYNIALDFAHRIKTA